LGDTGGFAGGISGLLFFLISFYSNLNADFEMVSLFFSSYKKF